MLYQVQIKQRRNSSWIAVVWRNIYYRYRNTRGPVVGIDAMVGAEYRFYRIPLTIGMEYKPFLELFGRKILYQKG